jgi:hypothetical protein
MFWKIKDNSMSSQLFPIRACKKVISALDASSTVAELAKKLNIDVHFTEWKNHPIWALRDGKEEVVIIPDDFPNKKLCVVLGYMMIRGNAKRVALSKRLTERVGGAISVYMRTNARSDRALRYIFDHSASFRQLAAEQIR